jgi:E3 ubiquitin-protein ligase UBR1
MHVRFGVDFSNVAPLLDPASSELDRLSSILRLPPLPQLIETLMLSEPQNMVMRDIIGGWIKHWAWTQEGKHMSTASTEDMPAHPRFPFSLSHPGKPEVPNLLSSTYI